MLHHLILTPEPKFHPSPKEGSPRYRLLYSVPWPKTKGKGRGLQNSEWTAVLVKAAPTSMHSSVGRIAVVTEEQGAARTEPWEPRFKAWCRVLLIHGVPESWDWLMSFL